MNIRQIKSLILPLFAVVSLASMAALCDAGNGPDLVISAIQVYPQHPVRPKAGRPFTVQVYVANVGGAVSGQYDIALFIRDVVRGFTYPIGTFRKEPMKPGESYPVYSSNDRMVNEPGFYRVHAEIKSFFFEDAHPENNMLVYDFVVD